ncbi:GATA transcription factor 21 [Raphanus sativus]|uniref:GATA transcription factor 21 n=1 Tax=Raphanus sativus TaxID=3726 RepID=A0A6J0L111_RAPSA|nr:GATA transcription factor 21 [Raphanus sativus]KAJ4875348.1 GATA transcription factor 21 [Raphanus sativus]
MGSNFHYSIDLNEDQNHHEEPFFYPLGSSSSLLHNYQVPSNSSSSSSSVSSLSSYLPFLINSQEDQHVAYNNTYQYEQLHLSQPLKANMFNGGSSSSSYDHMVPKKETRLKLTIRKKDNHDDQTDFLHQNPTKPNSDSDKWMMSPKMRLIKKTITNNKQPTDQANNNHNRNHKEDNYPLNEKTSFEKDHDEDLKKVTTTTTTAVTTENRYSTIKDNGYGNTNGVIRVCSDCNTTKTPLWRSGPRGPKSLCNACGIRQRKARRAAMAAAVAAGDQEVVALQPKQSPAKKKLQSKKKRSNGGDKFNISPPVMAKTKKSKIKEQEHEDTTTVAGDSEISKSTTSSDSSMSSNKLCFDDLTIMLSKNAAYQQVFPQDEKEAAILLMALSHGMVHG